MLLTLKEGFAGQASIRLKAKGVAVDMPPLPLAQDPAVTVELKNDGGACWSANFSTPAIRNAQSEFRAKSD